jgi:hypothetical protein
LAKINMGCTGVSGEYTISVYRSDGTLKRQLSFPNLITDEGMDSIGTRNGDNWRYCQVGTGSATPQFGDTQLAQYRAGTENDVIQSVNVEASGDYRAWWRRRFRFTPGQADGNLSEVGVGWAASGSLFSRALILDELLQPTTITVLSDEYLEVDYYFYLWPSLTDRTGQITLDGQVYDYVMRHCGVDQRVNYNSIGWYITNFEGLRTNYNYSGHGALWETNVLGAVTDGPSGTKEDRDGSAIGYPLGYTLGTYRRYWRVSVGLSNGNFGTGLGAISYTHQPHCFQIAFTPKIPKTADYTLTLDLWWEWQRRP